jgi:SET domain-containing protein
MTLEQSNNPPHYFSWTSDKIKITKSSINGVGYVAIESIKKDELLVVQSGQCVDIRDIDNEVKEPFWYYGFQVETNVYLYPYIINSKPNLDGIFRINHSCEPNAGFSGQISLSAMKDIEIGEEITYDYAMTDIETDLEDPWVPQPCSCNHADCRKIITGNDWKNPTLQKKYDGYFSTHVAKAIKNMNDTDAKL